MLLSHFKRNRDAIPPHPTPPQTLDVAQYTEGNQDSAVANFHPGMETEHCGTWVKYEAAVICLFVCIA
jgi:hypothetical protein